MSRRCPSILEERYHFEYDIGQWTFGHLSAVREKSSGIKRLCKSIAKIDALDQNRVRSDLQRLQKIQHPNLATLIEALEDDTHFRLIFEHADGGDASELLERVGVSSWLDEGTAAVYIFQLLVATAHCHSMNIYHRDLREGCIGLTSKLPDAVVKVIDFGLAPIFDLDNQVPKAMPSVFVAPEIILGPEHQPTWVSDMWSVGAIAYTMLINEPPYRGDEHSGSAYDLARTMQSKVKFYQTDGWADRSTLSRDFIRCLLCESHQRSTAAQALRHPWIHHFAIPNIQRWSAGPGKSSKSTPEFDETKLRLLSCTMAMLLVPSLVSHTDFDGMHMAFVRGDTDGDGFVARAVVGSALRSCGAPDSSIAKALVVADVFGTGVFDLSSFLVTYVLVKHFPDTVGWDLVASLQRRFFNTYGSTGSDERPPSLFLPDVFQRMKTNTMRQVEASTSTRFRVILAALPSDEPIDDATFVKQLGRAHGDGTTFALGTFGPGQLMYSDHDLDDVSFMNRFRFGFNTILCSGSNCSSVNGYPSGRDSSPHSVRV